MQWGKEGRNEGRKEGGREEEGKTEKGPYLPFPKRSQRAVLTQILCTCSA